MILEKIRAVFPEANRTLEQDLIIGSTCLALTPKERNTIENVNFNTYKARLKEGKRRDLSLKIEKSVTNSQCWGEISGFTSGGITIGVAAWYLTIFSPLLTVASGIGGGILGAKIGKSIGGNIGHKRVVKDVTSSPEYAHWKTKRYATKILPVLNRYVHPDKESKIQLVYSRTKGLSTQAEIQINQEKRSIPLQQEVQEFGNSFSKNDNVIIEGLEELSGLQEETIKLLTYKYNLEVFKQLIIVDRSKTQQSIPEEITKVMSQEEINKVVKLYSMTQKERDNIVVGMKVDLSKSLSLEDAKASFEFLNAAAKLPKLIKQNPG
jgi:hypothetical protein